MKFLFTQTFRTSEVNCQDKKVTSPTRQERKKKKKRNIAFVNYFIFLATNHFNRFELVNNEPQFFIFIFQFKETTSGEKQLKSLNEFVLWTSRAQKKNCIKSIMKLELVRRNIINHRIRWNTSVRRNKRH